jgi:hypothetical protein
VTFCEVDQHRLAISWTLAEDGITIIMNKIITPPQQINSSYITTLVNPAMPNKHCKSCHYIPDTDVTSKAIDNILWNFSCTGAIILVQKETSWRQNNFQYSQHGETLMRVKVSNLKSRFNATQTTFDL